MTPSDSKKRHSALVKQLAKEVKVMSGTAARKEKITQAKKLLASQESWINEDVLLEKFYSMEIDAHAHNKE